MHSCSSLFFRRFMALLAVLSLGLTQAQAQSILSSTVISGGGTKATAGNRVLTATAAQTVIGLTATGNGQLESGFWFTLDSASAIALGLRLALQGASGSGNEFLPDAQPYNVAPWSYSGSEVASIPDGVEVVDWVLISLRETPSGPDISRRAALLRSDGQVMDTDATSPVSFRNVAPGLYFVVVRHRNSLAIVTPTPVSIAGLLPPTSN